MTTPIYRLKSGGFLIDLGDAFPVWRADMGAVRRLLLDRDLQARTVAEPASHTNVEVNA